MINKDMILGMAVQSFVIAFLMWIKVIEVSASQQLISGLLLLIVLYAIFAYERVSKK